MKFKQSNDGFNKVHQTIKMIKRKIILLLVGALGAYAAWYAYNEFTRKPATAEQLSTDITISAEKLADEYSSNEETANKKFLNKTVEVSGDVEECLKNGEVYSVSLSTNDPMTLITVVLIPQENSKAEKIKSGQKITVKGICNGKLSDVELNKGVILN